MIQLNLDISNELDMGFNMLGQGLSRSVRRRLRAVLANPTDETWDDAHGILLMDKLTLWQAVIVVDPTFPNHGPTIFGQGRNTHHLPWRRLPDQRTLLAAIRYATH